MTIQNTRKSKRRAWRETLRLLALCAVLCVPLLFIAPVRNAGYRAVYHFFPTLQRRIDLQLYAGASGGDLASVQQALARGANIEGISGALPSSLTVAILTQQFDVALYLVQQGANVNSQTGSNGSNSPLFDACALRAPHALIQTLIQHGANINWQDDAGFSPLMVAVNQGDLPMVKLLLRSGANLDLRNKNNLTVLEQAHYGQQTSVEKYLLSLK